MSTPMEAIPTQSTQRYFPINDVQASADYGRFVQSVPTSTENIEDYFQKLVDEWRRDTAHLSLISQRVSHPAYKRILRMGGAAIPLILEDIQYVPGHWFHALITLADDNPVPSDFDGTIEEAAALWVDWGVHKGLIRP